MDVFIVSTLRAGASIYFAMALCNGFNIFVVFVLSFCFVSLAMSVCKVGLLFFVMFVVMHTVNMCTGVVVIVEDNRNTSLFLSLLCL